MVGVARLQPLTTTQARHFNWLSAPYLRRIVDALELTSPKCVRFVGGCVRDSLLGDVSKDYDLATTLTPEAVISALKEQGLGVAPTGIEHGTVTAIVEHKGVEITTLRADVSTDGRRASVAFTKDWAIDAARRDFRINAIYLTPTGELFDPVDGLTDIAVRRVRFIGNPEDRICEDYLRILRFFRFTARFSDSFDADGLAACAALKAGIGRLSAERVGAEMMSIAALPTAAVAFNAMAETGILAEIWPGASAPHAAARLKSIEPSALAPLVLAALFPNRDDGVGARLRLSNAEKAIRSIALRVAGKINDQLPTRDLRELIYRHGRDAVSDAALLAFAQERLSELALVGFRSEIDTWDAPVFPYSGRHVVEAGVPQGPAISAVLDAAESKWIAEGFPAADRLSEIFSQAVRAVL